MGAKYVPSIKDLKANQRFQQKQKQRLPQPKKPSTPPAPAPSAVDGKKP